MATPAPFVAPFYLSDIGAPLAAGLLYTYEAGTSTPKTTYSDSAGATPNANPIVLDAAGRASIYLSEGAYKFVLKDALGNTLWTRDLINNSGLVGSFQVVDTVAALKALAGGSSTYVQVMGYYTGGDGAGGLFKWNASSSAADDGGVTLRPSSLPVSGRWIRVYSGAVNLKWFGATGDGTTDDTAFMTAAGAYVQALALGGQLYVPPSTGNYRFTTNPAFGSKVFLYMDEGAIFTSANIALTISGRFGGSDSQHFSSAMGALQCAPKACSIFLPQWWGAYPLAQADTAIDHTAMVQKACNAAGYTDNRNTVRLGGGYWYLVGLDLSKTTGSGPITLEGQNNAGTILKRYSDTGHIIKVVNATSVVGWTFRNFQMDGRYHTGTGSVLRADGSANPGSGVAANNRSQAYDGIYCEYVALCHFEHVYIGSSWRGLNLAFNSVICFLSHCIFGSNNVIGCSLSTSGTDAYHVLTGCWFDENRDQGIYINCKHVSIVGCHFLDNTNYNLFGDTASGKIRIFGGTCGVGGTFPTVSGMRLYGSNNQVNGVYFASFGANNAIIVSAGTNNSIFGCDIVSGEVNDATGVCAIFDVRGGFHGFGTTNPLKTVDVNGTLRMQGGSKVTFGGSGASDDDTNIYRGGADILKTDDNLEVVGTMSAGAGNWLVDALGRMALRTTLAVGTMFRMVTSALTGVAQLGMDIQVTASSSATASVAAIFAKIGTAVSAFTVTNAIGVWIDGFTKGAGSTITNHYGLLIENINQGSTKNRAIKTGTGPVEIGDRFLQVAASTSSANDFDFPAGNFALITTTTTLNRIAQANWTAGSVVYFKFSGNTQVTHGTAAGGGYGSLNLAGAVNFNATAGDTLSLIFDGTDWWELARTVI